MERTDAELVRLASAGNLESFAELARRHQARCLSYAMAVLRHREDALDAVQNGLIRSFVRLGQLENTERFGSWLRQIVLNECRSLRRAAVSSFKLNQRYPAMDAFVAVDLRHEICEALALLGPAARDAVLLAYDEGYSLKEIAAMSGEAESTIKSRLRNARAKLRRDTRDPMENDITQNVQNVILAARRGDAKALAGLLKSDPSLVSEGVDPGHTALHVAAAAGNASVVELLLSMGADPNAHDQSDNASPLHYACERGRFECVRLLVEAGSDVNWNRDLHERGPLGWAVVFSTVHKDIADYLLDHGAKHDIFSAIALGKIDVVQRLANQDPTCVSSRRAECDGLQSTIEFAGEKAQMGIARRLAELGAPVGLPEAAVLGDVLRLQELLADRPDQVLLERALRAAACADQIETAKALLEHGVHPDALQWGCSLLFRTTELHLEAMSRALIEAGADLEFKDAQWKSTPLGWRVFFGDPIGVALCLKLGAEIVPNMFEVARSGERGELSNWSEGTPEGFREVAKLLHEFRP